MSLDERMRAGLHAAVDSRPVDTTAAWEQVRRQSQRDHTRRTVMLAAAAAAAAVAGLVWGPGIVDSLSGQGDLAPVDEPTPTDEAGADGAEPRANSGSAVPAGTYTYDNGPFPVTLTTPVDTLDMSSGADPYRFIAGDPYGVLGFDFPATAADLSVQVTAEEPVDGAVTRIDTPGEDLLLAGPIDFPADVGAWLEGAVSLEVVDQGSLSLPEGEASWWDVELSDPSATCIVDPPADSGACVVLWPYVDDGTEHQIGSLLLGPTRVYAIETGGETVMATADINGGPEADLPDWLATADEIVSSITLG